MRPPATPLLLVLATVLLQLVAAWLLDIAAAQPGAALLAVSMIAVVMLLHAGRFVIWGYTHRHFPLSHSYPLTALFFPLVLLLSWWRGDAVGGWQLAGTALITLGVVVMSQGAEREHG